MDVNKKNLVLVWMLIWVNSIYAEVPKENNSVHIYVEKKLKKSLVKWGEKVKVCQEKEEQNPLRFDSNSLKDLNISIDEFKTATITLNYNNFERCVKEEKSTFMYQSLLVYKIQKTHDKDGKDALNFLLSSLPSDDVLEAISKYEKLSPKVKTYFEKHIGVAPFNIVKASMPIYKYFRK